MWEVQQDLNRLWLLGGLEHIQYKNLGDDFQCTVYAPAEVVLSFLLEFYD